MLVAEEVCNYIPLKCTSNAQFILGEWLRQLLHTKVGGEFQEPPRAENTRHHSVLVGNYVSVVATCIKIIACIPMMHSQPHRHISRDSCFQYAFCMMRMSHT